MVGLLTVGSKAAPKQELIGDAGSKALVAAGDAGEKGIASFMRENKGVAFKDIMGADGLPPLPSARASKERSRYERADENAYPEQYPCRTFV